MRIIIYYNLSSTGCNKRSALHLLRMFIYILSLALLYDGCCCGGHIPFPSVPAPRPNKDSIATQFRPLYPQRHQFIGQHFIVYFSANQIENSGQHGYSEKTNACTHPDGLFQSMDN